jgi:DNA-binding XRE family transcriptional regulator
MERELLRRSWDLSSKAYMTKDECITRGSFISCHPAASPSEDANPGPPATPSTPRPWGEHLRRARLDRGLVQRQVAAAIGCHHASLLNWERGRREPELRYLPGILRFLGYEPAA